MRILVIGTGSIGQRHIGTLQYLVPEPQWHLLRSAGREDAFSQTLKAQVHASLATALAAQPQLAVIASPSALHAEVLPALLHAGVPCYVEKPVVTTAQDVERLQTILAAHSPVTLAGCNLRFLPALQAVKATLESGRLGRVVRASFCVGQWLPDWRPSQDYRQSYSARSARGGGVLMDLIHEVDAVRWLLGEFDTVYAVGGHYSSLEGDSEDSAVIALSRPGGPAVSVNLDYVARRPIRRYEFVGEEGTLSWDVVRRTVRIETPHGRDLLPLEDHDFDISTTYVTAMRELLACIRSGQPTSQDLAEGLKSVELALKAKTFLASVPPQA